MFYNGLDFREEGGYLMRFKIKNKVEAGEVQVMGRWIEKRLPFPRVLLTETEPLCA